MVHGIEVHLSADIEKYRQGMDAAKKIGSDSMGFISSVFDKIKSLAAGVWDALKSVFSGIGDAFKGTFSSISDSASGAFQKVAAVLPGFHSGLDQTKQKLDETSESSSGLMTKIGEGLVATLAAAAVAVAGFTAKGIIAQATLGNLSISNDIAASSIGKFQDVAARSGVSLDQLAGNLAAFQKAMKDAATSGDNSIFDKLGVKITDSNGALRDTATVAQEAAGKVANLGSEAAKYDAAAKLGFGGKVQLLEDIAHASTLASDTTDDQAAAAVRLGKIWHEILPGGTSVWQDVSKFFANNLTPAVTAASVSILESKNRIVDAFNQIYGGGSKFQELGDKIKNWGADVSNWFGGVVKSATDASLSIAKYLAAKAGLGTINTDAPPEGAGFVPPQTPLASGGTTTIETDASKKLREEYDALAKSIKEKIAIQQQEGALNATLTDGQRTLIKVTSDLAVSTGAFTASQKAQLVTLLNTEIAQEKVNQAQADQRALEKKNFDEAQKWFKTTHDNSLATLTDLAQEVGQGQDLTAEQKASIKVLSDLQNKRKDLSAAQVQEVTDTQAAIKVLQQLNTQRKAEQDAKDKAIASARAEVAAAQQQTESLGDQVKYYGLTEEAVLRLKAAELSRQLQNENLGPIESGRIQGLLDETQNQIELQHKLTQMKADTSFWTDLESTAHSVFTSITDTSKDAWTRLRDSAKTIFFDWLYQQTLKKWIISIGTSLSGAAGVSGIAGAAANASGGTGGTLGGVSSLLQAGKGAYDAITTGFAGVGDSIASGVQAGLSYFGYYPSAASGLATAGGQALTPLASGAGAVGSIAAGAGLGYLGGTLISGQYGSNATVVAGTAVGAAIGSIVPVLGTAVGAALGGVLGGIANRLFGMGDKEITSRSVQGTLTGSDFSGQNLATWHQDGGWFRSDKNGTDTSAVDATTSKAFTDAYASIRAISGALATTLGVDASGLATRSQALNIAITGDTTKDQQAITDFFNGVADTIAVELVPNLASFQATGETLSATLQRVSTDYAGVDLVLRTLGATAQSAFGATGTAAIGFSEGLIKAAGSLDALTSGTTYFAENFLTPAQQIAPIVDDVKASLASLGLAGVNTTQEYADAVLKLTQSGALATSAGQAQYAALLALAPQFKQATDYTDGLTNALGGLVTATKSASDVASERADLQNQLNKLTLTAGQLTALQRDAIDDSNKALFDQVQAAQAAKDAVTDHNSVLDQEAQMYAANGDAAGAAAVLEQQHAAALASLSPALVAATQATWDAQAAAQATKDAADEQSKILDQQSQLYAATGDKAGAAAVLQQQHVAALVGLSPALSAATQATWDAQAAEKAKADALAESNSVLDLQSQLYALTGDKAGAAAVLEQQHGAALVGLTPAVAAATQALWDQQAAEKTKTDALTISNSLLDIQAQIYQVTGNKAGAASVLEQQHIAALAAMDPALRGATEQLWAVQAAATAQAEASAQQAAVVSGYSAIASELADTAKAATAAAQALRDYNNTLSSSDASPLAGADKYTAAKQALGQSNGGNVQANLSSFLSTAKLNDTELQYARDFAWAQSLVAGLAAGQDSAAAGAYQATSSLADLLAQAGIGAHANGGVASGLSLVGEQGPEFVDFAQPARVYTASQTRAAMSGGDNSEVKAEIKLMREQMKTALDAITAHTKRGADNSKVAADVLDGAQNGRPLATAAA